ncbi:hypothetical protein AC579_351 [Pseudocercospora musae]|uniref:Uncharacterized protein n=1 Tax=Pseudocercospora musae TaxID=113226 RepID=A0A139IR52_9PEZI|nr:hypothetical protein AC579_351 [Pseudocercospora musae]
MRGFDHIHNTLVKIGEIQTALYKVHGMRTAICLASEPYTDALCMVVDVSHQWDLHTFLFQIALVDAESIHPQEDLLVLTSELPKGSIQIRPNWHGIHVTSLDDLNEFVALLWSPILMVRIDNPWCKRNGVVQPSTEMES